MMKKYLILINRVFLFHLFFNLFFVRCSASDRHIEDQNTNIYGIDKNNGKCIDREDVQLTGSSSKNLKESEKNDKTVNNNKNKFKNSKRKQNVIDFTNNVLINEVVNTDKSIQNIIKNDIKKIENISTKDNVVKFTNNTETKNYTKSDVRQIKNNNKNKCGVCCVLSHGYQADHNTFDFLQKNLKNYTTIIKPCREFHGLNEESVDRQSNFLQKQILDSIKNGNYKKYVLIGHSIGGNITINAFASLLKENPSIVNHIIKENIKIKIITLGSPLLGDSISKNLPDLFHRINGLDKEGQVLKELSNVNFTSNKNKNNLHSIYELLNQNVKILFISGKSKFLSCMSSILTRLSSYRTMTSIFKLLGILDIQDFANNLKNIGPNDGTVTVKSSSAEGIVPPKMNYENILINNLGHVDFISRIPSFIPLVRSHIIESIKNENHQLESIEVIDKIKYEILN